MKYFAILLVVATACQCKVFPYNTAYGYLKNSIAEADKLRQLEEDFLSQKIVGGVPAALEQYPYQAGLVIDLIGLPDRNGICGGSLISGDRLVTAAHCWTDGQIQAWRYTVVLGSVTIFNGGTRILTSVVATHPSWFPALARNDVAVIYLPSSVTISSTIAPVALPSGDELLEDFAGEHAIASGFGITVDGGTVSPHLNHVNLNVITNSICGYAFPLILQPTNICTSGIGGVGVCSGDSGGPLVVTRNDRRFLVGVTSFGSGLGCAANLPAAYSRVTSFTDFFNQHL